MTETSAERRRFENEYKQLTPANAEIFRTILNLAVLLLKSNNLPEQAKKENV